MKRPEQVRAEFAKQWIEKADADFNAAEYLLTYFRFNRGSDVVLGE